MQEIEKNRHPIMLRSASLMQKSAQSFANSHVSQNISPWQRYSLLYRFFQLTRHSFTRADPTHRLQSIGILNFFDQFFPMEFLYEPEVAS